MQRGLVGSEMCIRDRSETYEEMNFLLQTIEPLEQLPELRFRDGFLLGFMAGHHGAYDLHSACGVYELLNPIMKTYDIEDKELREVYLSIMHGDAVSYTHLTLPTILLVQISVVAVSLKKKKKKEQVMYESRLEEST
eukprot:TRINITY_DN33609_c0_g1_i1.p2 TRINITY_DN33609_c0_g1~~TRINITY_DN33609_c0_g1_i1.p2  ORF type:complete len:137 (-),score=41.95 TRINITY_DN33609_c0_g1_i1:60-470(-)